MKCDLCQKSDYTIVWDKTQREQKGILRSVVIRDSEGSIVHGRNVICNHCGLVQVNPKMSREELVKFYAEDYRKTYKGGNNAQAEKNHAETAWKILYNNIGFDYHDKLLDVGCSTGELLYRVEDIQPFGIEPNADHAEIAKSRGLNVVNCSIEVYEPDVTFDIITMLNALEHVYSPTEALTKIHSLLNDKGYILISVPNIYNRSIHIPVDAFLSNAHLYNFSIDTLTQYFLKCGFKIAGQYQVTEEMGDKIYLLGQKMKQKNSRIPKIDKSVIDSTIKHLQAADFVAYTKMQISQMGFK